MYVIYIFLAPIEGGYSVDFRKEYIKNMENYVNSIGGYFIDGFHNNGETAIKLNVDKIKEILGECSKLLPEDKLKIMLGAYDPVSVVEFIMLGIDVFDTSYVYVMTSRNRALIFSYDEHDKNKNLGFNINLADEKQVIYSIQYIYFRLVTKNNQN